MSERKLSATEAGTKKTVQRHISESRDSDLTTTLTLSSQKCLPYLHSDSQPFWHQQMEVIKVFILQTCFELKTIALPV